MDYQKIKDYRNAHNPYSQRLGILVEEIGPGYARVVKTVGSEKFLALRRALKSPQPRYTAPAPF